jgi:hypothetical protein
MDDDTDSGVDMDSDWNTNDSIGRCYVDESDMEDEGVVMVSYPLKGARRFRGRVSLRFT